jgi:dihydropteroate synthase
MDTTLNHPAALTLRAKNYQYVFPRPALVMGILNVTPDSFSDGGRFLEPQAAIDHGLELVAEGADLLDIGGESSRPFAPAVPQNEELRRVIPVISALADRVRVPISIDTQKPEVARAAVAAGASLVNDVAANRGDELMARLVAETGVGYVAMHMQGTPQTMQLNPHYDNVRAEVRGFFADQLERLIRCGVAREQIIFDVGIGFGKTLEHNLELLGSLRQYQEFARPLLIGVSRKSFVSRLLGVEADQRLAGSIAATCWAVGLSVQLVRTHDVAATRQAIRMVEAIREHSRT